MSFASFLCWIMLCVLLQPSKDKMTLYVQICGPVTVILYYFSPLTPQASVAHRWGVTHPVHSVPFPLTPHLGARKGNWSLVNRGGHLLYEDGRKEIRRGGNEEGRESASGNGVPFAIRMFWFFQEYHHFTHFVLRTCQCGLENDTAKLERQHQWQPTLTVTLLEFLQAIKYKRQSSVTNAMTP